MAAQQKSHCQQNHIQHHGNAGYGQGHKIGQHHGQPRHGADRRVAWNQKEEHRGGNNKRGPCHHKKFPNPLFHCHLSLILSQQPLGIPHHILQGDGGKLILHGLLHLGQPAVQNFVDVPPHRAGPIGILMKMKQLPMLNALNRLVDIQKRYVP